MTYEEVTKKLVFEMIQLTGHMEDHDVYSTYINRALVIGSEHFSNKSIEIVAYTKDGVEAGRFKSINDASKKLGIIRSNIYEVVEGKRHSAKGYIFKRVNNILL